MAGFKNPRPLGLDDQTSIFQGGPFVTAGPMYD